MRVKGGMGRQGDHAGTDGVDGDRSGGVGMRGWILLAAAGVALLAAVGSGVQPTGLEAVVVLAVGVPLVVAAAASWVRWRRTSRLRIDPAVAPPAADP